MGGELVAYSVAESVAGSDPAAGGERLELIRLWTRASPGKTNPTALAFLGTRAFVANGVHGQLRDQAGCGLPPTPPARLSGGFSPDDYDQGSLEILDLGAVGSGGLPALRSRIPLPDSATDVALLGDRALVTAWDAGLLVIDLTQEDFVGLVDADQNGVDDRIVAQVKLGLADVTNPGQAQGVTLQGALAFVAARAGGVQIFDVSNPDQPVALSAGNREQALAVELLGDTALAAGGGQGLTRLATPFTNVAGVEPAVGSQIGTQQTFILSFNRDVTVASISNENLYIEEVVTGAKQPRTAEPVGTGTSTWQVQPDPPLAAGQTYRLVVETGVTDDSGGQLLRRFVAQYAVPPGAAPQRPRVSALSARTARAGDPLILTGRDLAPVRISVGGIDACGGTAAAACPQAVVVPAPDGTVAVEIVVPAGLAAGSHSVRLENAGGLADTRLGELLVVTPLADAGLSFTPAAGPREGGTAVTVSANLAAFGPGMRAAFCGQVFAANAAFKVDANAICPANQSQREVLSLDVETLRRLSFTVPGAERPGLADLWLQGPTGENQRLGTFSFDLPPGASSIRLPSYPGRRITNLRVADQGRLYVASDSSSGLEIFDIRIPERALRLGRVEVPGPVWSLEPLGDVVILSAQSRGLAVVDVSNPARPFVVDTRGTLGEARGLARASDGGLWVAMGSPAGAGQGFLQKFELDTTRLAPASPIPIDTDPRGLERRGDRFFVLGLGAGGLELVVFDGGGARLGQAHAFGVEPSNSRPHLRVVGSLAFVTLGTQLAVLDIGDFLLDTVAADAAPQVAFFADPPGAVALNGIDVVGATAYAGRDRVERINVPLLNVLSVRPEPGATAAVGSAVEVEFSRPVKPSTATALTASPSVSLTAADNTAIFFRVSGSLST